MSEQTPGWSALLSGGNAVRSITLAGGVALHAINVFIATTILPSVIKDIGGLDYYAWNTTLFVIASIIGAAITVRLMAMTGPRAAYALAALVFGCGTAICALAPSMPVMLAGRIVQGGGGGVLLGLSYAMVRIVFAPALWPRGMALISGMWGVATLIGPAIGGFFAEIGVWRAAFWCVVPAAALFTLLAWKALPARPSPSQRDAAPARLPVAQLVLLTAAVLLLSLASARQEIVLNLIGILLSAALFCALAWVDARSPTRLLPRGSFALRSPLAALFATMSLLAITVTSTEIFVPLFLQELHGQSPLAAGYLAAMMAAGWTVGAIGGSGAAPRAVAKMLLLSPVISLGGMIALAFLVPSGSEGQLAVITLITAGLFLVGFGVGYVWPHLLTRLLQVAPADEGDLASASITTVQLSATAAGAALAGIVVNLAGLSDPGGLSGVKSAALAHFVVFGCGPLLALLSVLPVIRALRRETR